MWLRGRKGVAWLEWGVLRMITLQVVWIISVANWSLSHMMPHNLLAAVLGVWIHWGLVLRVRLRVGILRARIATW